MNANLHTAVLIAAMTAGTMLTRFLPFMLFRKKTPAYISYLGRVLPAAIIGMLVVFCLKDTDIAASPHGLPELVAASTVIGMHVWKRNTIFSILAGTAVYMLLIHFM